jgi:hypothetical protein
MVARSGGDINSVVSGGSSLKCGRIHREIKEIKERFTGRSGRSGKTELLPIS